MIKKILHGKINSIASAAMLVAFSSLLSRLLGVLRDRILASSFGAGNDLDIYYAAFRLPDALYNLIILGALSAGFIPLFAKKIKNNQQDQSEAWKIANNLINILGLTMLVSSAVFIIFATPLSKIFTPGFASEKQALVVTLSRIMFLSPIILGLSGIAGGILQSFKRFFIYSLSPIFYNIGIIIGAIYFVPLYGIVGLAWGVVLGASMHLLIQLPTLFDLGYRYQPIFDLKAKEVGQIIKLMIPRTLALSINQIDLIVSTTIASTLSIGSLTIFNLANNLQYFPIGIFGISFATAAFPFFSEHAHDNKKLIEHFSKVLRQILFFIIPSTVLFLILRAQIIRIILGAGAFNWDATNLTLQTLGFFTLSLFAQASIPLITRVYYAREDSKTPFIIGMITVVIDIILAIILSKLMGVKGIALAYTISSIINFILLWFVLHKQLGELDEDVIIIACLKFTGAALIAGIMAQLVKTLIGKMISLDTFINVVIQGSSTAIVGLGIYLVFCLIFNSKEAWGLIDSIKHRIKWNDVSKTDQSEARGI